MTKKEGKEVESLRSERRKKAKEEKEKSLRKERSSSNMQEKGKQEQIVEKSLHAAKKPPNNKNRRKVSNLDLQKVKEAQQESSALAAKKLEVVQPVQPALHLPLVGPPLHLPLGQSLATLHLNLAELAHIRKQVGFKCFHFMSIFLFHSGIKRLARGAEIECKHEN